MLSMNGIIALELILGVVLMSLIFFTSLADTDLIADSSSKSEHDPESEGLRTVPNPGSALNEISCQMYMSVLAGDYYWAKATGAVQCES